MESEKLPMQEKLRDELQELRSPQHDGKEEESVSSVKDAATPAGSPGRAFGRMGAQNVYMHKPNNVASGCEGKW